MNFLIKLRLTFLMLVFSSCLTTHDNEKSLSTFSGKNISVLNFNKLASNLAGGAIIYGVHQKSGDTFSLPFEASANGKTIQLMKGPWNFYAIGWSGNTLGERMMGSAYCGSVFKDIVTDNENVGFNLSASQCAQGFFGSGEFFNTSTNNPKSLKIFTCENLSSITSANTSCTTMNEAPVKSLRLHLPQYRRSTSLPFENAPGLLSQCFHVDAYNLSATTTGINLPVGPNGGSPLNYEVVLYNQNNCQGQSERFILEGGMMNSMNLRPDRVKVFGPTSSSTHLFLKNSLLTKSVLDVSLVTHAFGEVQINTSATQIFTFMNNTNTALTNCQAGLAGSHPGYFSVTSTCSSIAANNACAETVTVNPTAVGQFAATLRMTCNEGSTSTVNNGLTVNSFAIKMDSTPLFGTNAVAAKTVTMGGYKKLKFQLLGDAININAVTIAGLPCHDVVPGASFVTCHAPSLEGTGQIPGLKRVVITHGPSGQALTIDNLIQYVPNDYGDGADGVVSLTGSFTINSHTVANNYGVTRTISKMMKINNLDQSTGTILTLDSFSPTDFEVGDEVMWMVMAEGVPGACSNTSGGVLRERPPGRYGFARIISSTTSTSMTLSKPIVGPADSTFNMNLNNPTTSGTNFCRIQVIRVPNFESFDLTSATNLITPEFSLDGANLGFGGLMVFRVRGSLISTTNATLNSMGSGHRGGLPDLPGQGLKGKVNTSSNNFNANAGGSAITSIAAGGGAGLANGGNGAGSGSSGGMIASTCNFAGQCALIGGGGGGGKTAGGCSPQGGAGGGVTMVFAGSIQGLFSFLNDGVAPVSNGVTCDGAGGGGGGRIFLQVKSLSGSPTLNFDARGGNGQISTSGTGGGGGGGGEITIRSCSTFTPASNNIAGGAPGTPGGATGGFTGSYSFLTNPVCN